MDGRVVYMELEYTVIHQLTIKYSFKIYMLITISGMKTGEILLPQLILFS